MKKQLLLLFGLLLTAFFIQAQDHTITLSGLVFTPNNLTINAGETVEWVNQSGTHNVNSSLATYPSNPEGFFSCAPSGTNWTFSHTFTLPGTYEYRCDPHFSAGMTGTIVVEEPIPAYDIATVSSVDADGVVDSLGVICQLQGLVYGIDFRGGNGVQFVMRDNTGGLVVFSTSINYYTVTEGDEIIVQGEIDQFNGLVEMVPDTIILVSSGNTLEDPVVVTAFDESTEGELVRVNGVSLVDPAQWTGSGSGFNVDLTDGVNTYSIRIDNDCDLYGQSAPDNTFDVVGLGWQFDNSSPYTSGYQIYPRYIADFIGANFPSQNDDYPAYDIGVVTTVDANGDVDSIGVKCQLQGIVHSGDLNGGSSIQFFFQDATGGISLFSSDDFGYTVNPGDEVVVRGTISTFNCLSQISPDTLWLESSGNALFAPFVVVGPMTEAHEGEYLQFNNLSLVDPGQWTGSGAGFNVDVTDGVNTYQMRIDNDVDLYSLPAPTGTFNALGLGSQFSSSDCNTGYQFLPRSVEDIISTGVREQLIDLPIRVFPNPASDRLFAQTDADVQTWTVFDLFGKQLLQWDGQAANGFDVSGLTPGMYLLQASVDGGVANVKFIVE
jgi:plastocyanin